MHVLRMAVFSLIILSPTFSVDAQPPQDPDDGRSRFMDVLNGEAVKDVTTGLIWERSPDLSHFVWTEAIGHCEEKRLGDGKRWHLPSIKELATLIDQDQKDPALPKDHPFSNIRSAVYWSSTPSQTDDIVAWHVSFFSGQVVTDQKSQTRRAWCVRTPAE